MAKTSNKTSSKRSPRTPKPRTRLKLKPKVPLEFKRGQSVKFQMFTPNGVHHFAGKIVKLVPKGALTGDARFTVKCTDGAVRRPYPSQCQRS